MSNEGAENQPTSRDGLAAVAVVLLAGLLIAFLISQIV